MSAPDPFLAHEALDRTAMIAQIWSDFIEHHRFVATDPELQRAAAAIGEALGDFYQQLGRSLPA